METINRQFGHVVAYLLPGFIGLGGVSLFVPTVKQWLQPVEYQGAAGVAPTIYAVLAAIAMGMILSCFRWLIIDHVLGWIGIKAPIWNAERLEQHFDAFNLLVEHHYRYYQFYANTLVALLWTYSVIRLTGGLFFLGPATDLGIFIVCLVLFAGSRDALSKYYDRTNRLISDVAEKSTR